MTSNISVCMAVKNGADFIHDQLSSILPQLAGGDELVISDDHSTDATLKIIEQFGDPRIRIYRNTGSGIISNFENSLKEAQGKHIFLADQDDVWMPDKVEVTMRYLKTHDLVVSDCMIVDENMECVQESFFQVNRSRKGLVRNLMKNSYMGCCMAFHRKILMHALPIPAGVPMHDLWLGLTAEMHYHVKFISHKLVFHRRHTKNASTTSLTSKTSMVDRLASRFRLLKNVIALSYAA